MFLKSQIKQEESRISLALSLTTSDTAKKDQLQIERAGSFPVEELFQGKLKRSGRDTLLGICPFHEDHAPSFSISKSKNLWHCFGCQRGGNVIQFLMETEHLEFPAAVRRLS